MFEIKRIHYYSMRLKIIKFDRESDTSILVVLVVLDMDDIQRRRRLCVELLWHHDDAGQLAVDRVHGDNDHPWCRRHLAARQVWIQTVGEMLSHYSPHQRLRHASNLIEQFIH